MDRELTRGECRENGQRLRDAGFLVAIGVLGTSLAQPQTLGHIALRNLLKNELHVGRASNAAFFFWIGLAWYFKPLFGMITDAVPLLGSRRRSYILAGAFLAALCWAGLYFTPHRYNALLWACTAINVFMVATSTVVGAYMVEAAQASSASGRLSSVRNLVEQLSLLLIGPIGGFLAGLAFGWTAAACGIAIFLVVPGTMFFLQDKPDTTQVRNRLDNAVTQLGKFASSKTMWAAVGFMALFYCAPGIATALFYKQQNELHLTTQAQGNLQFLSAFFGILAAGLYGGFACRRYNLRALLLWSLGLATAAAFAFLAYSSITGAALIESFNGFSFTLAEVALMDLAVRATPQGSEGLGFSVMMSVRNFSLLGSDWFGAKLLEAYHLRFNTLILANGLTTLVTIPLVLLLPAIVLNAKDLRPAPITTSVAPVPVHAVQE